MAPTRTLELLVDRPVHGGRCVAYPEEGAPTDDAGGTRRQVVLLAGALPGERVTARVEVRKGVAFGEVIEVTEASTDRVEAPVHPGLDLGHVAYERQLTWKHAVLEDAVRRAKVTVEHVETGVPAVVPSPETWGYRHTVQPAVVARSRPAGDADPARPPTPSDDEGAAAGVRTALGYRRPGGHDLVTVDSDPTANTACATAWDVIRTTRLPRGVIEVAIRGNDAGEALVSLIATSEARDALDAAHALVAAGVHGVALSPHDPRGRFRGGAQRLAGARTLRQRFGDVEITLNATAFAQPNAAAAGALFRDLVAWTPEAGHALDLYAGNGVIGMHLAPRVGRVTALEIDRGAVERGRADAARQGFTNVMHVRLDVRELAVPDDVDLIVVDPPRAGLAAGTRAALAASRARTLLYVSCDVATWARDVADLTSMGFRLDRLRPYDFQPHTHHLEIASRLVR
jgi:23S rRNA (uracil1939-C5)-methyltransferase